MNEKTKKLYLRIVDSILDAAREEGFEGPGLGLRRALERVCEGAPIASIRRNRMALRYYLSEYRQGDLTKEECALIVAPLRAAKDRVVASGLVGVLEQYAAEMTVEVEDISWIPPTTDGGFMLAGARKTLLTVGIHVN